MNPATYVERIRRKLEAAMAPIHMQIIDDSARHSGHAGYNSQGETHIKIKIVSPVFAGLTRVARHRLIYEALAEELRERIHALNIEAFEPNEPHS